MSDYKRLTENELTVLVAKTEKCTILDDYCCDRLRCEIYNRLADLEDKIENGTLVEFNKPFYSNQLKAWCIFLREGDYIKSLCLTKEQAEEYQKKSQEEQEYELSIFI